MSASGVEVDDPDWLRALRSRFDQDGAILLRGFVDWCGDETFEQVSRLSARFFDAIGVGSELCDYDGGATPRLTAGQAEGVYRSTDLAAVAEIVPHNETSYMQVGPRALAFWSQVAAEQGGETPIAWNDDVVARMSSNVTDLLRSRGIRLERFIPARCPQLELVDSKLGKHIPYLEDVFPGLGRAQIEDVVRAKYGTDMLRWDEVGSLWLGAPRNAFVRTPSGSETYYAHIVPMSVEASMQQWYSRFVDRLVASEAFRSIENGYDEGKFREIIEHRLYFGRYTFGDGSPIPKNVVHQLRAAIQDASVMFPWQAGDIMILDNQRVMHGRKPYRGQRSVLVTMGGSFHSNEPALFAN